MVKDLTCVEQGCGFKSFWVIMWVSSWHFEACEVEVVGSSPFFSYVVQFFFFVLPLHINYNINIIYTSWTLANGKMWGSKGGGC